MESTDFYPARHLCNYDVTNDRCCNNPHCSSYSYAVTKNYHDNNFMCNNFTRDNITHYNFPKREIPR